MPDFFTISDYKFFAKLLSPLARATCTHVPQHTAHPCQALDGQTQHDSEGDRGDQPARSLSKVSFFSRVRQVGAGHPANSELYVS